MSEKTTENTTVKVTMKDGMEKQFAGDTALILTVSGCREFLEGKAHHVDACCAYMGASIPAPIFAETISGMIISFVKSRAKSNMTASYDLHQISELLERESASIVKNTDKADVLNEAEKMLNELFDDFRQILHKEL